MARLTERFTDEDKNLKSVRNTLMRDTRAGVQGTLSQLLYESEANKLVDTTIAAVPLPEGASNKTLREPHNRQLALLAARRDPGSGRFLDAPRGRDFRAHLNDAALTMAAKIRLGLHVFPVKSDGTVPCPACKCDMTTDPSHIFNCSDTISAVGRTRTHSHVKNIVLELRAIGGSIGVARERALYISPNDKQPGDPPFDPSKFLAQPQPGKPLRTIVADVLASRDTVLYAVDITIFSPTAKPAITLVDKATRNDKKLYPQLCTQYAEAKKNKTYLEGCQLPVPLGQRFQHAVARYRSVSTPARSIDVSLFTLAIEC